MHAVFLFLFLFCFVFLNLVICPLMMTIYNEDFSLQKTEVSLRTVELNPQQKTHFMSLLYFSLLC